MTSTKRCCVPDCNVTVKDNMTMHGFPNPEKDPQRFKSWLYAIGGNLWALDYEQIHKKGKVCHKHFEEKYRTWTKNLSANAIPTLHLRGSKKPLTEITNKVLNRSAANLEVMQPSTSTSATEPPAIAEPVSLASGPSTEAAPVEQVPGPSHTLKTAAPKTKKAPTTATDVTYLQKLVKKLKKKKDAYAVRLKKASRLFENDTFQKYLKRFTTLAALFTVMQFREISKPKMGRRFSREEKIMALSLYKQGPRAYRWLSKVFILPSPITLSRLVSKAGIKPGINKRIFQQLKKRVEKMTQDEKLCILLFDEVSITPHFDYNRKSDAINGFTNNGIYRKKKIADHALVFMVRGVIKNYKQPIAYTFCNGTTPADELKVLIKNVIKELLDCGLNVIATVCDQGSTNVSAINKLINETREEYLKNNLNFKNDIFEVNKKEIIPLFDTPHLLKGIRNNLITKNLKCIIDNKSKTAKWEHILNLFEENPSYKGIRLIKNLSEAHVIPKKIAKMKVKYATQVFSKTVATNMGYLAEKGILPDDCRETADVLLFFDDLFDSLNGSYDGSKKKMGKSLLGPVTPTSDHTKIWQNARTVLRSMKFVTKNGKEGSVPSISNWLRTLNNMEYMKNKIFNEYNFKSLWMRHFNQDPLENFFGCIRSHGCRNISPSPSGFESAFVSLLVSNVAGHHSKGSNCEEDFCKSFDSMATLFTKEDETEVSEPTEIDFEDTECEIVSFDIKKRDPKIYAQLSYVSGYVLRQAKKKIFKNCSTCKECFYSVNKSNAYLTQREYFKSKACLTYPSENLIKFFSEMQDIITKILQKKSDMKSIKYYCKTIVLIITNCNFVICQDHKDKVTDFIVDLTCRFFIYNWCRDVNKLMNGSTKDHDENDFIKKSAVIYSKRNKKT